MADRISDSTINNRSVLLFRYSFVILQSDSQHYLNAILPFNCQRQSIQFMFLQARINSNMVTKFFLSKLNTSQAGNFKCHIVQHLLLQYVHVELQNGPVLAHQGSLTSLIFFASLAVHASV